MPTQVMKFGVRSIIELADEAAEESAKAHRYYNALVAVERDKAKRLLELQSQAVPELGDALAEIDKLSADIDDVYDEIRETRRKASAPKAKGQKAKPTKTEATDEQRQRIARLKSERAEAWERAKKLRAQYTALVKPARVEFDRRSSGASQELLDQIADMGARIKAAKKVKNNPEVDPLKRALDDLKKRKKAINPTHKKKAANTRVFSEMLEEAEWPDAWKAEKRVERESYERAIKLRSGSGLRPGTYKAVEDAVKRAVADSWEPVHFRSWNGGRKIGCQVTKNKSGYMTGDLLLAGGDTRLRIVDVQPLMGRRDPRLRRARNPDGHRERWRYAIVQMPMGDGRFVSAEVLLHRPIPKDAEIRWFYLVPRMKSGGVEYTAQFTVTTPRPLIERASGTGECSVRLRWHKERTNEEAERRGIVVAEINGEPFAMSGRNFGQLRTAKGLLGQRDENFEGARAVLVEWMKANPELVPEWMQEACAHRDDKLIEDGTRVRGHGSIHQWRRHEPLMRIAERWVASIDWLQGPPSREYNPQPVGNRKPRRPRTRLQELWVWWRSDRAAIIAEHGRMIESRDTAVFFEWLDGFGITNTTAQMALWLEWWRRKDVHLKTWGDDLRAKGLNRRKDAYRCKAAELATRYERVVIGKVDLKDAAKRKTPDRDATELHQQARYQRFCAAPSEFVLAIKHAFGPGRWKEKKGERSGVGETTGGTRDIESSDFEEHSSMAADAAE